MRLRSYEILIGTHQRSYQGRAHYEDVEEEQWDNEFARSIKGEPRQPVHGINSDHVLATISDRAGVHLEEDQADARLGQQDDGIDPPEAREVSMPPDRLVTLVRSDTLKRMYATSVQDVPRLAVITKPVTRTHAGTGCAQNWRRTTKRKESILPENKHVWMEGNRSFPLHQATNVLCQRNGIAHQKIWRMGEEDVTMKQDITATGGASSSSASRGPAMDTESRPSRKRVADIQ